jgi:hypothetical protein
LYRVGTSLWNTLCRPNLAFSMTALMAIVVVTIATRFELSAGWFGFAPPPAGPWFLALMLPLALAALLKALQHNRPSVPAAAPDGHGDERRMRS